MKQYLRISLCALMLILVSCATTTSNTVGHFAKASEAELKIKRSQTLYEDGDLSAAISMLKTLIDQNVYTEEFDQAYELMIEWLLETAQTVEAQYYASYFLKNYSKSPSLKKILGLFDSKALHEKAHQSEKPSDTKSNPTSYHQKRDTIKAANLNTVGVLLPMSGSLASFGQKVLAALSLAFDTKLLPTGQKIQHFFAQGLTIILADSQSDAKISAQLVDSLVNDHGVTLIIGDITADSSLTAALRSQQYGVPMLSLARHPMLSQFGDQIFVFNASSEQDINFLVNYAMKEQGFTKFAIVYPMHNYGIAQAQLFYQTVLKSGGEITALENYYAHETTFTELSRKLLGTHYLAIRPDYLSCEREAKVIINRAQRDRALKSCRDNLKPVVDFEALFIPDFQSLAYLIPALIQEDLLLTKSESEQSSVQVLGPSSWNDPVVISRLGNRVNGAVFVDTVDFDHNAGLKSFSEKFTGFALTKPSVLEVFAYDAAKLALTVLAQHKTRSQIRDALAMFDGRVGLLENISFSKHGELITSPIAFTITNGQALARTVPAKGP